MWKTDWQLLWHYWFRSSRRTRKEIFMLWGKHILSMFPHCIYSKADNPSYFCQVNRLEKWTQAGNTQHLIFLLWISLWLHTVVHITTRPMQSRAQDSKNYLGRDGKELRCLLCRLFRVLLTILKGLCYQLPQNADKQSDSILVLQAIEWLIDINCSALLLGYLTFNEQKQTVK